MLQCAQRWEELLLSGNSVIAGDFSGLTATGRPISGYRQRKLTKLVHSMIDQQSPTKSASEIRIGVGSTSRPHSVMSNRSESLGGRAREGARRSLSTEDRGWGQQEEQEKQGLKYRGVLGEQAKQSFKHRPVDRDQLRILNKTEEDSTTRGTFAATYCKNLLNGPKNHLHQEKSTSDSDGAGSKAKDSRGETEDKTNCK